MIKEKELLAARSIEDRLAEEAKSSRGSLFGDSISDLMKDASYYLSLLLDELDAIKDRQCFPHGDICDVLLCNLNALEESVYEIVDRPTLEKIVARKIELQNENRVAKAVKQGKKMMHKSKCRFCVEGIVLDDDCNNVIGSCYCDIDQYDEEIGCNRSCHGYSVANAVREIKEKQ